MPYYLAPWARERVDGELAYVTPFATMMGQIDLRSRAEVLANAGMALWRTRSPEIVPGAMLLADDLRATVDTTAIVRGLGLGEAIVATTLGGVIEELLLRHGGATTATRWGQLMPGRNGVLEIHLGGPVMRKRMVADAANSETQAILARAREDYRTIYNRVQAEPVRLADFHRKWLGYQVATAFRGLSHELLIPPDLPSVEPLPPETTVSDNFQTGFTDGADIAGSANWAYINFADTEDIDVHDKSGDFVAEIGSSNADMGAIYQTSLSGAAHYSEVVIHAIVAPGSERSWLAPVTRHATGVTTDDFFAGQATIDGSSVKRYRFGRHDDGAGWSFTDGATGAPFAAGDTLRLESNGSSHTIKLNGSAVSSPTMPITDSNHSANIDVGFAMRLGLTGAVTDVGVDDFAGADLAGGGVPSGLSLLGVGA